MKPIYIALISLLITSCGIKRNTFIAPLPNNPMFTEKGDVTFNSAASPTHIEFQGSCAITNHLGITVGRFYGGSPRKSDEIGINAYTRVYKSLYFSTGFGWGKTAINNQHKNVFMSNENINVRVNYNTLFVHPALYLVLPDEDMDATTRVGISFKYGINTLNDYYYYTFENEWHSSRLSEETIITADRQRFFNVSSLLSVERNTGNLTLGIHSGLALTSSFKARYQYHTPNSAWNNRDYFMQEDLYYLPFVFSGYIGIRL